jgi:TonB family protein
MVGAVKHLRVSLMLILWSTALELHVSAQESACDFSTYKPVVISHALLNAAMQKVEPNYPAIGKNVRAQGEVQVKLIVNRRGTVVAACATEGHPLLRQSAVEAAYQWKFGPNFVFSVRQKRKYIQAFMVFTYRLE